GGEPRLVAAADMTRGAVALQLAEMTAEGELLVIAEALVAEHQHRVAVHAGLDRGDLVGRERLAAIDAGHLADEQRMEQGDRDGHAGSALSRGTLWQDSIGNGCRAVCGKFARCYGMDLSGHV